jgi:hypothetical protein
MCLLACSHLRRRCALLRRHLRDAPRTRRRRDNSCPVPGRLGRPHVQTQRQRGHVRARRHEANRIVPQTDREQASLWVRGHRHHGS